MRRPAAFALVALVALWRCGHDGADAGLRVGTFNIEYYPQSESQARLALDAIAGLDAPLVAVQEITSPLHLARMARARLGERWRLAVVNHRFATGVLFDSARFTLQSTQTHEETVVYPNAIPVFEARLTHASGGAARALRVFVVHWRAGGDNAPTRKRQMDAFEPILVAARASGDDVVVLGDFNATSPDDRARIAALAEAADLAWATRDLPCTCFWQRETDCVCSPLDQVLTSAAPTQARVGGACATDSAPADKCPSWRREVSDHCPVVVEWP